jgi:hypothetical protein
MIQKDDDERRELAIMHYNDTIEALRAGMEIPVNLCEFRWLRSSIAKPRQPWHIVRSEEKAVLSLQVRHRGAVYSPWSSWKDIPIVDEE